MVVVNVLDQPQSTCEVCGNKIRYVHILSDRGREIRAGGQCAEKLCGGVNINRARRRSRWLNREWTIVPTTHFTKVDGHTISVAEDAERPGWYRFYINGNGSRPHFSSLTTAKLAAFDCATKSPLDPQVIVLSESYPFQAR